MYARVPQPYGAKYNTVEVLKNPTKAELRQFAKETPKALRWGKDTRGNYYFWDAYRAIHLDIEQALQKDDPALEWDAFEWQSFSEDFIGSKPAEVATEAELRGYDFRVQRERQWMTITPKGEGVPSSETLRWQRSKAKQQELTFRITLEAIPSPKTEAGQRISEMPFDLQLAFTREVNETAPIKRIAAELGIDVYVTEQTGGYHGMVAPNNVVQVRSAEDATKLARALALTRTQESVPWFHVSQQEPPTGDLAVYIEFDEDLTLDQRVQLSSLLSRVGKDISFTELGENRFAIINFSNIENFEDKVHDAIAQVEGMGRTNDFDLIPFNPDESFYEEYDWSKSGTEEEIVRLAGFTPTEAANLRRWRQATQSVADNFLDQEKQKLTRQDFKPGERLDRPVVEPDGTITLHHWSTNDNISEIDPVFEGSGIRAAERVRAQAFPEFYVSRSNYGINVGLPGGYVKEFSLGRYHYTAKINADDLYDAHGDPNNLKRVAEREIGPDANDMAFHNAYERAIRDAGFKGFWVNNGGKKGITAAVFEPLQASRVQEWRNEFIPSTDTSVFRDPETGRWVNLDNVLSSLWARQEREQGPGGSFESVPLNNEAREVINSALQNVPKAIAGMVSSFGFLENHQDPNVDGNFSQGDKSIDIPKKTLLSRRGMKVLFHEMGHAISMWYSGHNHIGGIVSKSPLYHFNPLNNDEAGEVIDETGQAWDRGWELIEEVKGRTSAEIDASERGVGTLLVEARRLGYSDKDIAYIQTAVWMNYPLDSLGNIVNHYQMAGALGTGTLEQVDLFLRQVVGFSRQTIQEEVFAQHHSMYHVAPALMKQTLPKAYEVINEIYTLVAETNTLGAANAAVFRALRTPRPANSSESVLARDFVSKSNAGNSAEWRSQRQPPSTGVQRVAARRGWNRSGNTTRRDKVWAKLVNWFGWMTPTSQFVYRPGLKAFWDGYSDHLDEQLAYDERRSLAQGEVWRGGALAKKVVKVFDGLPESMLSGAYEYFTTPNVSAKQVINKPPEWTDKQFYQWTRRVERVKRILESVGQQLVDIGLLSQEVFEQHKGSYLPRMYLQYVLGDEGIHMLANHGRLDLNYLKRRKDVPKHIRELFLGEIKDPGFLLSMAVGRGMRDIAIHKFLDDVSTNQNWVAPATLISIPVGEQYDHDDPNGNYAKGDEIYVDVTPQWAKHEGERILSMIDKYHPATRKAARAVANRLIAGADRHLENANIQFDTKTYELLPDSAKYGHLRGAWVRKEIAWDVKGAFSVAADMDYMGWYLNHSKKLMGYWKVNKIALNPPTIARNIMSNMILLNLSGMPLFRPTKHNVGWMMFHDAIKEINSNGKYYREFVKRGGKSSTFSSAELSHIQGEFKRYYQGSGRNVMYAMAKAVDAIYETAGDVYQFTEMVGKIAKMKYEVEVNNLSMGEAMHEANKWLFDYSFVPKAIEFVRSEMVFGVPFITFYYKVIARIAETAVKHPTRFLPYVALSYGMQPLIAAMMPDIDDDDIERAKTELPYFIRERLGMIPLPFRDANGNLQFLDMSYIFPWTMPLDTLRAAGTLNADKLASTLGLAGSPLMSSAVGWISNKHPFYRTDIWKEKFMADAGFKSYDKSEQITSRLNYLWNVWTPGLLGTTSANPIVKTAEAISPKRSAYLRTPPTVGQAGLRFIGINVYPTNKQALINNARIMQTRINSFKAMVRSEAARDLDSTKETFDKYLPRVLEFEQELADYMRNMGISEEELRE
jgi:hypothetical protein